MRVYRPNLLALSDGGRAQQFAANVVHIDARTLEQLREHLRS